MTDKTDEIFILKGSTLRPVTPKPLQLKQFGKSVEEVIQNLLEKNPALIPGNQMNSGSEYPKFVHLGKGYPIGVWKLDHLFVDQFGILTFVETKLINNPAASRAVIGKLIDFAASARDNWYGEKLQKQCYEYFTKITVDLDSNLRSSFGVDLDIGVFWKLIEENLRIGKVRLLAVSDYLRPEVRRMLEYLNSELANAQVYGLEIKVFSQEDGTTLIMPRLYGQTEASIAKENQERARAPYSTEKLEKHIDELEDSTLGTRLRRFFNYAVANDLFLPASAWDSTPSFSLKGGSQERLLTFYLNGNIGLFIHEIGNIDAIQRNDMLMGRLKKLSLLPEDFSPAVHKDPPFLSAGLTAMSDMQFTGLTIAVGNYFNAPVV